MACRVAVAAASALGPHGLRSAVSSVMASAQPASSQWQVRKASSSSPLSSFSFVPCASDAARATTATSPLPLK